MHDTEPPSAISEVIAEFGATERTPRRPPAGGRVMNAPFPSSLRNYAPLPAPALRARLETLLAYRRNFAATRPADMPAVDAAIARHRALLDRQLLPDERARPELRRIGVA